MKTKLLQASVYALLCSGFCLQTSAQLSLSAQLRTRTELRDGYGMPLPGSAKPALFTSQRTRLNVGYHMHRLKFGLSLQDVRLWGQDVSTINQTTTSDNNALMLHEAWGEILLTDTTLHNQALTLKIGRQELIYDDQRLLGNLDWLQQARRHDAAVLKYESGSWTLHAAGAFNQNKENNSGTIYNSTPAGNYAATTNGGAMYKSMQFIYAAKKFKQASVSFLFFRDNFSKFRTDTVNSLAVKTFGPGSRGRATTGFYYNGFYRRFAVTASAYYQFGKSASAQQLRAALLTGAVQYKVSGKSDLATGIDYASGGTNGYTSNAFDPLYGTPHKFMGLMDYFYAASPFGNVGLTDYYLKWKYKGSDKFLLAVDLHHFNSASALTSTSLKSKRNLGQEIDAVGSYRITKQVGIEVGYAHYFSTSLLTAPAVKNIPDARSNANWAYVMINIKPDFLVK